MQWLCVQVTELTRRKNHVLVQNPHVLVARVKLLDVRPMHDGPCQHQGPGDMQIRVLLRLGPACAQHAASAGGHMQFWPCGCSRWCRRVPRGA
jgi:hypothetical protein